MSQLLTIVIVVSCADVVLGAFLVLPISANCGNQTVLTCTSTGCNLFYRFTRNGTAVYTIAGPANGTEPGKYTGNVISNNQSQLTITKIQLSDSTTYACNCGYEILSDDQPLKYECKATTSDATITNEKKLSITVDSLYPKPSNVVTSLTSPFNQLQGNYTCESSTTLSSHYRCTWMSTASFKDGNHSYTIMVTTGTQAAHVTGSFMIVTPTSPTISNLVTISNNRQVLTGIEDTQLTIQCVSNGGIPAPTLAWYKGNTSRSLVAQSSISDPVQQSHGTYTVTLNHTFAPRRTDDLTMFLCRVFYPGATDGASPNPSPATALIYLNLKPDIAEALQTDEAVSGGNMTLRCTSTNGRPAPNITWSYLGGSFTSNNTSSYDLMSETYNVVSVLLIPVSSVDNGKTATCSVLHTTLSAPLKSIISVDVKFGPSTGSTTIHGRQETQVIEANPIQLNCTSGSSNPASNITWYNGSNVISYVAGYKNWSGDNNGVITSNNLTITPTRYMDGDRITCKADNSYGSDSTYVDLDILYSTLIEPLLNITSTEGEPNVTLTCLASSKPPATFTWNKTGTVLAVGTGTITDNSFSYTIPRVDRTDAGSYQCLAGNSIGSSDLKNMYLIVRYPPTVTVSTTFFLSYTVTCTAEGYPDIYTYQDWVQIWPGYGPVATIPFTDTTLNFTGGTYERSGVYVCGASNGVFVYDTDVKFMKGNATILIEAPPVLTHPSPDGTIIPVAGTLGQDATFEIKYWSNVDGSVVKCYKLVGGSRSSSSICSVTETDTEVMLPVYDHIVKEIGTLAIIKIRISSQEDMTVYDVVVSSSGQGESVLGINIIPEGHPQAPILLGNFSITPGQVILTVLPGFHGGYNQTLVVQISTDLTTWINKTSVYIGLDSRAKNVILVNLRENMLHHVRVIAYNVKGGSNNFSAVMNFTTAKDSQQPSPSSALVGGTVGAVCALLAVAVVLAFVWRIRKAGWVFSQKTDRGSRAKDQDNTDSVVECALYVSAENVQPGTSQCAVYATPQKIERSDPSANVYAVVSKNKKGLPEIPQMAATTFNSKRKTTSNRRTVTNVNGDRLIYADLDFDSTAVTDVVHGLDDATIYAEIDRTRTAENLPDSDEESTEKKKS